MPTPSEASVITRQVGAWWRAELYLSILHDLYT